jgi:hypothetical protein
VSVEQFIDGLCNEAKEAVRALLRQAYDRGFREGLASTGQQAAQPVESPPAIPAPAPAPEVAPEAPTPPAPVPVAWSGQAGAGKDEPDEGDDAGDVEGEDGEGTFVRPILPLATVGTLRRRITRTFDLERFEIDVVICRAGDPDRRQLKSSVRLSSYRSEDG